ncbi:MAG: ABC transporter permease [Rhizobiaceae bacterium]
MLSYLLRRFLGSAATLVGVSVLIFGIARIIPGDPAQLALGPAASAQDVKDYAEHMGLNLPLPVQYMNYIKGLFHGDMGISLYTNRPVIDDIRDGFPATLELVLAAMVLMVVFGITLGVLSAWFRNRPIDHFTRIFSLLGIVTPTFVWAIFLMLIFSDYLGWMPISGRLEDGLTPPPAVTGLYLIDSLIAGQIGIFWNALYHLTLPAIALALPGLGQAARLTRVNIVDAYQRPFAEMSRAYGLPARQIALKYMLRPALIPTITVMGLDVASKLGNAFLVESVFVWPGVANYGVQTILQKDLNGIVGTVLVISAFFLIVNMLVDIVVAQLDPRIRLAAA